MCASVCRYRDLALWPGVHLLGVCVRAGPLRHAGDAQQGIRPSQGRLRLPHDCGRDCWPGVGQCGHTQAGPAQDAQPGLEVGRIFTGMNRSHRTVRRIVIVSKSGTGIYVLH